MNPSHFHLRRIHEHLQMLSEKNKLKKEMQH